MSFELYDYVDDGGKNLFKAWTEALQKPARAKLNAKLDMLKTQGRKLFPELLTGTPTAGILKLRFKAGNVALRPMLCEGPLNMEKEYTLLMGATERDDKFNPPNADKTADKRKNLVKADPKNRRAKHERVS